MELGNKYSRRRLFILAFAATLGHCSSSQAEERFIRQPKKSTSSVQTSPAAVTNVAESASALRLAPAAEDLTASEPQVGSISLSPPISSPSSTTNASAFNSAATNQMVPVEGAAFRWKPRGTQSNAPVSQTATRNFGSKDAFQLSGFRSPSRSDPISLELDVPTVDRLKPNSMNSATARAEESRITLDHPQRGDPTTHPQPDKESVAAASTPRVDYARIATGISQELMDQHHAQRPTGQRVVPSIETPPGWQAVGARLSEHMRKCEQLIARKANLSAIEEAEAAVRYLLRVLDLHGNQYQCEPCWSAAQQALYESEDFADAQRIAGDQQLLTRLIESHETRILKEADVSQLSPLAAPQHYHSYAQYQLVQASAGHPWASELYYVLGRALQSRAEEGGEGADALRHRALTYYRAARDILPTNAVATNQLGFLLLGMDKPADAREALVASVKTGGPVAAWQNLVEANRRLGDAPGQNWAMQNFVAAQRHVAAQPPTPAFVELDPRQFASLSPRESGPKPPPGAPATSMPLSVQPGRPTGQSHDGYTANANRYFPAVR